MQTPIPATYIRGGTSKGTFFNLADLPESCQVAGQARDALLLRVVGSPDPYGKQIDGLGNSSSSTSKVAIISPCTDGTHDVNYLFGKNGLSLIYFHHQKWYSLQSFRKIDYSNHYY